MAEDRKSIMIKENEEGSVRVADEVIAIIAGLAATEVEGVSSIAGNITNELVGKLGMRNLSKGIKIEMTEDSFEVFLAINILLAGAPFMFLILCLIILLDGGLGLLKVTIIRMFKVNPMKNLRTPLHDHFRKKGGWSNTQVVNRFMILQALISLIALGMVK